MADELGAVVDRGDLHAFRQLGLEQLDTLLELSVDFRRVAALGHRDDAFDDAGALVGCCDAVTGALAFAHLSDVAHGDRAALARSDDDVADVGEAGEQAVGADHQRFVAVPQEAAAGAAVAEADGLVELFKRDLILAQRHQVDFDLVLADRATEAYDIGNARRHAQEGTHRPVLNRADLGVGQAGGFDGVAIDFADSGRERRQLRLHAGRERDGAQPFDNLLAGEVVVRAIGERQGDDRQAAHGYRADVDQAGDARNFAFDRQGDGAFHILRRLSRQLRNDAHLNVLNVGKGFDRQVGKRIDAEADQCGDQNQNEDALFLREGDDAFDHGLSPIRATSSASSSNAPVTTMLSPPLSPSLAQLISPPRVCRVTFRRWYSPGAFSMYT